MVFVAKKHISWKTNLWIYQWIYVSTFTYGHELLVVTERTRSGIQEAERSFLHQVARHTLKEMVRSLVTQEELGVEPLVLCIATGQLRWPWACFGCLLDASLASWCGLVLPGGGPGENPGQAGRTISWLDWKCLAVLTLPRFSWPKSRGNFWDYCPCVLTQDKWQNMCVYLVLCFWFRCNTTFPLFWYQVNVNRLCNCGD